MYCLIGLMVQYGFLIYIVCYTPDNRFLSPYFLVQRSTFVLGSNGKSCTDTCSAINKKCSRSMTTYNSVYIFHTLGAKCNTVTGYYQKSHFGDNPVYKKIGQYNDCLGYVDIKLSIFNCASSTKHYHQRLCKCV